ncbi:MAG: serine/threonine protein kinase [Acidimicrobiales bacterium]
MPDATTIGGYQLVGVAGSGGFAVTYVAAARDDRPVALKVLSPNWLDDLNVVHRFEAECELLETAVDRLGPDGAGAVPGYVGHGIDHGGGHGVGHDRRYLATELCEGGSLAQRMPLHPPDRLGQAAWVVDRTLAALGHIHDRLGIIHRDVSPANLLFRPTGDGEQLVVADFGLTKEAALKSNFSRVVGTAVYAAPEVREQGVCDTGSDIYSVGVIAWEMLSGRSAQLGEPLEPLTELADGVPPELAALVSRMTATDRDDRPSGGTVRDVVAPWITSPPPAPAEVWRPLPPRRRNRVPVLLATVLAVVTVVIGSLLIRRSATAADPLTDVAPAGAAFRLELEDDWVVTADGADAGIVAATSEDRLMILTVAPMAAATPATAVQLLTATDLTAEVIASTELPMPEGSKESGDRRLVRYLNGDGNEVAALFAGRSCGTLGLSISSADGPFDDDELEYVSEVGERLALIDGPTVPRQDDTTSPGLQEQTAGGVRLSLPTAWFLVDDPASCLTAVDVDDTHSRYLAVTFWPSAAPATVLHQFDVLWPDGATETPIDDLGEGILRRRLVQSGTESVFYAVPDTGGTYAIRVDELMAVPLSDDDLATFDQIVRSFRVVS